MPTERHRRVAMKSSKQRRRSRPCERRAKKLAAAARRRERPALSGPPAAAPDIEHSTSAFEAYYAQQAIVPPQTAEWSDFCDALHRPLPVALRWNQSGGATDIVAEWRARGAWLLESGEAQELGWCDGWQLRYDRKALADRETPQTQRAHRWLSGAVSAGAAQRQETVSMIPAALLQVQPHHACLDMCASPGSKTTQVLEALHALTKTDRMHSGNSSLPAASACQASVSEPRKSKLTPPDDDTDRVTGCLVANDFRARRAYTLCRRCDAVGVGCASLLVTVHPAQHLPPPPSGRLYDRIVCDVPCTGDGAIRKVPDVWRYW